MVLRHTSGRDRHKGLRWTLLILGMLSIFGAIAWPLTLAFGIVASWGLLFNLDVEGLFFIFTGLVLTVYRTVKTGDEHRIQAQRRIGLISGPFAGLSGSLMALIPFIGASPDRIIDAGRSVLQFDAFLAIGWTIGFSFLDRWLKEVHETRRELLAWERRGMKEAAEAAQEMAGKPAEAFAELVASIAFFIFSGIFAVLTVLTANSIILAVSTMLVVAGVGIMLIGWYELYRSATFLQNARDDLAQLADRLKGPLEGS